LLAVSIYWKADMLIDRDNTVTVQAFAPTAALTSRTPTATATITSTATPTSRTPTLTPTPPVTRAATTTVSSSPVTPQLSRVDELLARCPTAAETAAIDADFKLTFDSDPVKGTLASTVAGGSADLTLLKRPFYETVQVAKRLTFSKPLPWTS